MRLASWLVLMLVFGSTFAWAGTDPPEVESDAPAQQTTDETPQATVAKPTAEQHTANAVNAATVSQRFKLYGIDAQRWETFVDGQEIPLDQQSPEFDLVVRTLSLSRRFTPLELKQWQQQGVEWTDLATRASAHRGQILRLAGTAVFVEPIDLEPSLVERFEISRIYRCELLLGEEEAPATVFALTVPSAWPVNSPINERVTAQAFFLKRAGEPPSQLFPVFVTQRIAWHPQTLLGELGMDVGLFDTVRHRTTGLAEERECFYELLAVCQQAGTNELARHAAGKFSVVPLFNTPEKETGQLVGFTGVARRIVKVLVESPEIRERFGIDHYYQLAVFTPDSQDHPIICSVLELPPGMPTGERLHEPVRISGFFLKLWGYRAGQDPNVDESKLSDEERARLQRLRHLSPLLIGKAPIWIQPEEASWASWVGLGFSFLLIGLIAVLWFVVWWQNRVERRLQQRTLGRHFAAEEGVSLNEIGLEYRAGPDFSNLPQ